jgi:hypothetical protein
MRTSPHLRNSDVATPSPSVGKPLDATSTNLQFFSLLSTKRQSAPPTMMANPEKDNEIGTYVSPKLGCTLHTGTFLQYLDDHQDECVGQFMAPREEHLLLEIRRYAEGRHSNRALIITGNAAGLRELTQISPVITTTIADSQLIDFAFVFHPGDLEGKGGWHQGIHNAFICRSDKDGKRADYRSFPEIWPRSIAEQVFDDLEAVRDMIAKKLNRKAESQGEMTKIFERNRVGDQFWAYIQRQFSSQVTVAGSASKRTRIRMGLGHHVTKQTIADWDHCIRIQSSVEGRLFNRVFGEVSLFGTRKKLPTLREKSGKVNSNDTCNHVPLHSEDEDEDEQVTKFQRIPPARSPGVDLIYNKHGEFGIRIRYWKTLGKTILMSKEGGDGGEEEQSDCPDVQDNDYFDFQGETYLVTAIHGTHVEATSSTGSLNIQLGRVECARLIEAKYQDDESE